MRAGDIKSLISIRQILEMYGINAEKKRISCPIHDGKDPNFAIYESFYKCYSCGEYGDIFDLVQALSKVDFREAFTIICRYFNLSIPTSSKEKKEYWEKLEELRQENEERKYIRNLRKYQQIRICQVLRAIRTETFDSFLELHLESLLERYKNHEFYIEHDIHAHLNAIYEKYQSTRETKNTL